MNYVSMVGITVTAVELNHYKTVQQKHLVCCSYCEIHICMHVHVLALLTSHMCKNLVGHVYKTTYMYYFHMVQYASLYMYASI